MISDTTKPIPRAFPKWRPPRARSTLLGRTATTWGGMRIMAWSGLHALSACTENNLGALKGTGEQRASLIPDPVAVDFGTVPFSEDRTEVVTLTNVGSQAVRIDGMRVDGASSFSFTWPDPIDLLPPGDETEVLVTYVPAATSEDGRLVVASTDPVHPELRVPLTGSVAYGALAWEPDPIDFGGMELGESVARDATLVNVGEDAVEVHNIGLLGGGYTLVDAPSTPFTLEPGAAAEVSLRFDAMAEGWFEGLIWADSDAPVAQVDAALEAGVGVGDVEGQICGPNGEGWAVGARVWITGEDGTGTWIAEDVTDEEGSFFLEQVRAGVHTVNVQKGSWTTDFEIEVRGGGTTELAEPECLDPGSAKVAVVTGEFDHVGTLLTDLGIDFDTYSGTNGDYLDLLEDAEMMSEYDIIFFNCGMSFGWLSDPEDVVANLRAYVADGGSVYASDWAYGIVEAAWPAAVDFIGTDRVWDPNNWDGSSDISPYLGAVTAVDADVVDSVMRGAIGSSTARVVFDLDAWVAIEAPGTSGAPLLTATVPVYNSDFSSTYQIQDVPLAVRSEPGGTVIYTAFHNDQQPTDDMVRALQEIILSL